MKIQSFLFALLIFLFAACSDKHPTAPYFRSVHPANTPQIIQAKIDSLSKIVERTTRKTFKVPVTAQLIEPSRIQPILDSLDLAIYGMTFKEALEGEAFAQYALGYITTPVGYADTVLKAYGGNIAGFYETYGKKIYVVNLAFQDSIESNATLVHELTHHV